MQNPGVLAENVRSFKRRGRSEADAVRDALMAGQMEGGGLPGEGGASGEVMPGLMGGNTGITGGMKIPLPSRPGPQIKLPRMGTETGPMIPPSPDVVGAPGAPLGAGAAASPDVLPMQGAPTAAVGGAPNGPFVPGGGGMEEMLLRRQLGGQMQAR